MEENNNIEVKQKTSAQDVLITKIMKSGKILDKEYKVLRTILDKQVTTSYDAGVFIEYVLGMLKFRRTFLNGKHKAYKKCHYCNSRTNVVRVVHVPSQERFWVCENCNLNLDPEKFTSAKGIEEREASVADKLNFMAKHNALSDEEREVAADLFRKYDYPDAVEEADREQSLLDKHGVSSLEELPISNMKNEN